MKKTCINIEAHMAWFRTYVERLRNREQVTQAPITLKLEHTFAVLERAKRIAEQENLPQYMYEAVLLAALYHDVARFEQYLRWHTFKDSISINHGLFGAQLLKRLGRLTELDTRTRILILAAVALHNRYAIPTTVPDDVRLVTHIVRDADKLDILRVMDAYFSNPVKDGTVVLHVKNEPEKFTLAVLDKALHGCVVDYSDLYYENDFRILLGTWIYDLHFAASRNMIREEGYIQHILQGLPHIDPLLHVRNFLLTVITENKASICPHPQQG